MDVLSNLKFAPGSKKTRKRVGRGEGSGHGGQATRGMNGQKSRSGFKRKMFFEGGQMPLQRRVPKRGFKNIFRTTLIPINVEYLEKLAADKKFKDGIVNPETLYLAGAISKKDKLYKILGNGELKTKLSVEAYGFSESAKAKIESAGGTIKTIES